MVEKYKVYRRSLCKRCIASAVFLINRTAFLFDLTAMKAIFASIRQTFLHTRIQNTTYNPNPVSLLLSQYPPVMPPLDEPFFIRVISLTWEKGIFIVAVRKANLYLIGCLTVCHI